MNSPIYKLPFCLVIYVIGNYDSISAMPTLQWLKENDGEKLHGSNRTTLYTCVYNYKQCRKKDQICDPTAIDECQTYVLPEDLNKTRCCEVNPRALTLKEQHDCYNWFFSDNANDAVLAVCAQNKDKRKTESPTSSTTITTTPQEEMKTTPGPILTAEMSKCPKTSTWEDSWWMFLLVFLVGFLTAVVSFGCCLYHCEESTIDSLGKKLKQLQCRKRDTKDIGVITDPVVMDQDTKGPREDVNGQATEPIDPASSTSNNGEARSKTQSPRSTDGQDTQNLAEHQPFQDEEEKEDDNQDRDLSHKSDASRDTQRRSLGGNQTEDGNNDGTDAENFGASPIVDEEDSEEGEDLEESPMLRKHKQTETKQPFEDLSVPPQKGPE